jgi:anti-anti-sigma regulatory factor
MTIMNVKIDTKEKFHVISILEPTIHANMTEDMMQLFNNCMQNDVKNIILNLKTVSKLEDGVAEFLLASQQKAYENGHSFVICEVEPDVETVLDEMEILELMNTTPTESEAWDIVQMEEIERELLGDE